jgi:hypothetical protein
MLRSGYEPREAIPVWWRAGLLAQERGHTRTAGRNQAAECRSEALTAPTSTFLPAFPQYDTVLRNDASEVIPGPPGHASRLVGRASWPVTVATSLRAGNGWDVPSFSGWGTERPGYPTR